MSSQLLRRLQRGSRLPAFQQKLICDARVHAAESYGKGLLLVLPLSQVIVFPLCTADVRDSVGEDRLHSWAGAPAAVGVFDCVTASLWQFDRRSEGTSVWILTRMRNDLQSNSNTCTNTRRPNQCVRPSLLGIIEEGKKDREINSGHPAKAAAAVWSHVTTTVSERRRGRIWLERGAFQVHSPLDNTHTHSSLAYSYASYGELVVLTLQEKKNP